MMRRLVSILTFLIVTLMCGTQLCAQELTAEQKAQIAEQRKVVEELEQQLAEDEKRLKEIKQDKSNALKRMNSISRQIKSRTTLLTRTEREIASIERNISTNEQHLKQTTREYEHEKQLYAEMVREAYRNHQQNNYIIYILASRNFTDAARRMANIRAVAEMRAERMQRMDSLKKSLDIQHQQLALRRHSLDSVQQKAQQQRKKLQVDVKSAERTMSQLSSKEKAALKDKMESEERLDAAIDALRKLTKGNKEGASFSRSTSNLNLPVEGGTVRRYKGNMAEIVGRKDAAVSSIYEGKVVEVKRNRISGQYDVFVAHGEYITSYANLERVTVEKNAKVGRNQKICVIGTSVNLTTMQPEYKMVFGIYSPNPKEVMRAADCFKKK
ncbi:MAG: peptidoglycan DD-metalloendopeptidase family protein [Alistipes sp.]|nr:peptidoglycan DD-metalloendopeptidase family protein [Alistipes sp.]